MHAGISKGSCAWDRDIVPCAMATEAAELAPELQTNPLVLSDSKVPTIHLIEVVV
ncbi:MAG: hypothetical protein HC767_11500 [Akkermansiaceae bacterium]|nr:hypothetical protein [Akkermansiaceae bacterium]